MEDISDDGQGRRNVFLGFLGEDTHSLDEKGRVVLPRRYRDALSDGCIVAKGQDHQLQIFTREAYEERAMEVKAMGTSPSARRFQRMFFGGADEQKLDKAGRLLLKGELRKWAGLTAEDLADAGDTIEVKVVGVMDHIELWQPAAYDDDKERGEVEFTRDEDEMEDPGI